MLTSFTLNLQLSATQELLDAITKLTDAISAGIAIAANPRIIHEAVIKVNDAKPDKVAEAPVEAIAPAIPEKAVEAPIDDVSMWEGDVTDTMIRDAVQAAKVASTENGKKIRGYMTEKNFSGALKCPAELRSEFYTFLTSLS